MQEGPRYHPDFIAAAHHANKILSIDYSERHIDNTNPPIHFPKGTVYRPNHGLAHTLRTTRYSPVLLSYYQKHEKQLNLPYSFRQLTEKDLLKVQIAQLFYITGRESEYSSGKIYYRYQAASGNNFANYAKKHLSHLYTPNEIEKFRKIISQQANNLHCPEKDLIYGSHGLDLMRCKDLFSYGMPKYLTKVFGAEDAKDIIDYTHKLMFATGEASVALWGVYPESNDLYARKEDGAEEKFETCSLFPVEGLTLIDQVQAPKPFIEPVSELEKLILALQEEERGYYDLIEAKGMRELTPLLLETQKQLKQAQTQVGNSLESQPAETQPTEPQTGFFDNLKDSILGIVNK